MQLSTKHPTYVHRAFVYCTALLHERIFLPAQVHRVSSATACEGLLTTHHLMIQQADVNVIAWNVLTPHTLASGGDEGRLRVWDLRAFEQPVADFSHHRCACRHAASARIATFGMALNT